MASLVAFSCVVCDGPIEPGLARNLSTTCHACRGSLPRAAALVSSDATQLPSRETLPPAAAHGNDVADRVGGRPSEAALQRTLSMPVTAGEAAPTSFPSERAA